MKKKNENVVQQVFQHGINARNASNAQKSKDILKGLNPQQKKAVQSTKGEVVVMAGAGSGKTRVLTRRIAYLIAHDHVSPYHILAVTFTNKASQEMKTRINKLLGTKHSGVTACTFHAFGFWMLHHVLAKYPHLLAPYNNSFGIIMPSSQKTLVKHIITDKLNLDKGKYDPKRAVALISRFKNNIQLPKQVRMHIKANNPSQKVFSKVYTIYEKKLAKENQMDFDDLLLMPYIILKHSPEIRAYYQNKFQYISVDEYQDVNSLQRDLLEVLSHKYHNLFVVGDVNQSIYSWRGSKPQYILNFKKDHPKAKQIIMEQNYRSTKNILRVANAVISHNKHRTKQGAFTENPDGPKVAEYSADSTKEEANFVGLKIQMLHQDRKIPYDYFAILYRTNFQSRLLEQQLFKLHIPNKVLNGTGFFEHKEIKDIIAYMQLLTNKQNMPALERIINVPKRQIGKASVNKLSVFAYKHHYNMLDATLHVGESTILSNAPKKHIFAFGKMMQAMRKKVHQLPVEQVVKMIYEETGYTEKLKTDVELGKHREIAQSRLGDLNELINTAKDYDDAKKNSIPISQRLKYFLSYVALMSDQDTKNDNKPKVLLMTLHAAKGMEFPIVFLVGMAEGTLPLKFEGIVENIEEERRLCYVGMTRAEKMLYLSYGETGQFRGSTTVYTQSRFLDEIPSGLLQPATIEHYRPQKPTYNDLLRRFGI